MKDIIPWQSEYLDCVGEAIGGAFYSLKLLKKNYTIYCIIENLSIKMGQILGCAMS
jgi:hypothetical protein